MKNAVADSVFKNKTIMVVGGGSAGHVSAAKSVMEYMVNEGLIPKSQVIYLGGRLAMLGEKGVPSLEKRIIEPMGYRFISISGGKLHRFFTFDLFRQFFLFLKGFAEAYEVLRVIRPDLLFSAGGFVTVPPVMMAKLLNIPVVLHEQTVVSGLANRITAKFADKICVSHESSFQFFPRHKTMVTGNPINHALFEPDIDKVKVVDGNFVKGFKRMLKTKAKYPILFMTGGGQGSHQLNMAFYENLEELLKKYSVILQVGDNQVNKDYDKFITKIAELPETLASRLLILKFFREEVGPIMNHADIVVSRGGANTLNELETLGKKAVVVTLDGVSGDEQYNNAMKLAEKGLAVVYREGQFNMSVLLEAIAKAKKLKSSTKVDKSLKYRAEKKIISAIQNVLG